MLTVNDLNVRYGMHEALTSVSLQVSCDEIVVILGANGAGKSTLLSAIAGSCVGDVEGNVNFNGEKLLGLDVAQVVEHGIAYVPEGRGVFADLSVEENLQLGSYAEHARHNEHNSLRTVLSLFPKLQERKKQIVRTMSGGEQQMVAIGRALMSSPAILMLDEPSLGLSPLLCKELFSSLVQVRDSGVGIFLVEQNAKQSLSIADRGYLLGNGKIIGHDSAKNLLDDPTVQAAYLGGVMATQQVASVAPTTKEPVIVREPSKPETAALTITPLASKQKVQTVSSDDLLDEDVDALVNRASSNASQHRDSDTALPVQVVKLSGHKESSATGRAAVEVAGHLDPLQAQGTEVQALLDEFEAAAKNAAGRHVNVNEPSNTSIASVEDNYPLPHVPVYKKSSVTVYRRDGSGILRKQDKQ